MTRKERGFLLEAAAIVPAAFLLAIVIPRLVNLHDTVALFAALILLAGSLSWLAYFAYRLHREFGE